MKWGVSDGPGAGRAGQVLGVAENLQQLFGLAAGFGGAGAGELAQGTAQAELGGGVDVVGVVRAKLEEYAGGILAILGVAFGNEVDEDGQGVDARELGLGGRVRGEQGERGQRVVHQAEVGVREEAHKERDYAGVDRARLVVVAHAEVEDGGGGVQLATARAVAEQLHERRHGAWRAADRRRIGTLGRQAEECRGRVLARLVVAVLEHVHDGV